MGFRFWRDPGPFAQFLGIDGSWGRLLGFWRVLNSAAYAFSNVENISVAAAEMQNPRHNIPKAAKRVFWRILTFNLITIFRMGLVVPSNDTELLSNSGDIRASPFAIADTNVGITVVSLIINAVVVTSAWGAGNSGEFGFPVCHCTSANPKIAMLVGTRRHMVSLKRGMLQSYSFASIASKFPGHQLL